MEWREELRRKERARPAEQQEESSTGSGGYPHGGNSSDRRRRLFSPLSSEASASQPEPSSTPTTAKDSVEHQQCKEWLFKALTNDMHVNHMLAALSDKGCPVDPFKFFTCKPCNNSLGYWSRSEGIVLCENNFVSWTQLNVTLVHELIHAYDDCRAKLNWKNCVHHACSEIRAASLSGDCHWYQEFARGNFTIGGQHRRCIRRRAILSLELGEDCKNEARSAVKEAWPLCSKDTAPFGFVP
ncbi:Mitochondrial inner membrane protease ATP23 [Balamuthia mandrillaris]